MTDHRIRLRIARILRVVQIAGYAIAMTTATACLALAVIVSWWLIVDGMGGGRW